MRRVRRHRRAGGGRPQGELEAEGTNRAGRLSISRPSSIVPFQIERVQGDEEKHAKLEAEVTRLEVKRGKMSREVKSLGEVVDSKREDKEQALARMEEELGSVRSQIDNAKVELG